MHKAASHYYTLCVASKASLQSNCLINNWKEEKNLFQHSTFSSIKVPLFQDYKWVCYGTICQRSQPSWIPCDAFTRIFSTSRPPDVTHFVLELLWPESGPCHGHLSQKSVLWGCYEADVAVKPSVSTLRWASVIFISYCRCSYAQEKPAEIS